MNKDKVQEQILEIIYNWVEVEKGPITLKQISLRLPEINPRTVRTSAETLCNKGYLRRGIKIKNNSCYILIRMKRHE